MFIFGLHSTSDDWPLCWSHYRCRVRLQDWLHSGDEFSIAFKVNYILEDLLPVMVTSRYLIYDLKCWNLHPWALADLRGGMPPYGTNFFFIFAYIFKEKHPRRRSTPRLTDPSPPMGNPGSVTAGGSIFILGKTCSDCIFIRAKDAAAFLSFYNVCLCAGSLVFVTP